MRKVCKYCDLPSIAGFIGDGICKYHWAGHLQCMRGEVPKEYKEEYREALHEYRKSQFLKRLVK